MAQCIPELSFLFALRPLQYETNVSPRAESTRLHFHPQSCTPVRILTPLTPIDNISPRKTRKLLVPDFRNRLGPRFSPSSEINAIAPRSYAGTVSNLYHRLHMSDIARLRKPPMAPRIGFHLRVIGRWVPVA